MDIRSTSHVSCKRALFGLYLSTIYCVSLLVSQTAVGQSLIHRYGLAAEAAGFGVSGFEGHMATAQVPKSVIYAR